MMTALAYSTVDQVGGLKLAQVYSDQVVNAFARVEQNTYHYGIQSRPLMQLLAKRGPDYLHAVTSSEAETLKTNAEFKDALRFPLVFVFPADGTYWSEQPYCILKADWVTPEQTAAARIFRDYLLAAEQQALAVDNYVRPVDESIPLHAPLTLEDGTDPRVTRATVPALESPSAEVANAVKDVFHQTKKKATIIMVIDTSGSMEGDKIKAAADSSVNFVKRLDPNDQIYAYGFGGDGQVYGIGQGGRAGEVGENMTKALAGIYATGNTPLYDAVCTAAERLAELQAQDQANGERRLYGIVLLSDGEDTASRITENQMFNCLPSGEDVEGFKVFTIAFGEDANADLMLRIANRTNGKTFTGGPETIETIYNSISAEQ
jgi:Ca-activated chloride channel family protein